MTHGNTNTYPQLGRLIGFILKECCRGLRKLLTIQRDYGNRENRKTHVSNILLID